MTNGTITGLGLAVPERKIDNAYFDIRYQQDLATFLSDVRGIQSRYHLGPEETTSDLIVPAAQEAMAQAGVGSSDIDMLIVATDTPDYLSPPTAVVVARQLGLKRGAFDLNAACAGFIFALDQANCYLRAKPELEHILVVGAYGMSKFFNWDDYKVTSVFADGCGAVLLSKTAKEGIGVQGTVLGTDASYVDAMGIFHGAARHPDRLAKLEFRKRLPPELNVELWPDLVAAALDRSQAAIEDVDLAVFTQINRDTILATAAKLGLARDTCMTVMDRYGYTGSACLPMALYEAQKQSRIRNGDLIVLCASGGGINMGAMALRWDTQR